MLLCLLMHIACKTAVTRASSKLQSSLMRTPGGNTTRAAHSESHKLKDLWVCVYVHILAACLIWTHSIGCGGGGKVFFSGPHEQSAPWYRKPRLCQQYQKCSPFKECKAALCLHLYTAFCKVRHNTTQSRADPKGQSCKNALCTGVHWLCIPLVSWSVWAEVS